MGLIVKGKVFRRVPRRASVSIGRRRQLNHAKGWARSREIPHAGHVWQLTRASSRSCRAMCRTLRRGVPESGRRFICWQRRKVTFSVPWRVRQCTSCRMVVSERSTGRGTSPARGATVVAVTDEGGRRTCLSCVLRFLLRRSGWESEVLCAMSPVVQLCLALHLAR